MTITTRELANKLRGIDSGAAILLHRELTGELGEDAANALWERACDALTLEREEHSDGPVHDFFGLSYSAYQVVPRVLAQSMPHEWQARFVACMEEMQVAFGYLGEVDYEVQPAVEKEISDLSDAEMDQVMERIGITVGLDGDEGVAYFDRDGNELRWDYRVLIHVPDLLPPYSRGRTRVPRADQMAQTGGES